MKISQVISTLWNGGLDPATAPPIRLGERRMVSAIIFLLVPSSLILIIGNIIWTGDLIRMGIISTVLVLGLLAIYFQAYRDKHRIAALGIIFTLWFSPLLLLMREGFSSTNWAWWLPVILLANYIMSRKASIVFTAISVVALIFIAILTEQGIVGHPISVELHSRTIAVAGSIIFILACVLGYAYRTTQLKSEEQLLNSMSILRDEVETRRTAEIKALAGERAKATFLATVSHELRTPLNGVIGATQLLASQELDDEKKDLVNIIDSSADILLEVINNVLDLSRLDEGKLALQNAAINLHETIESCLSPLRIMCEEKRIGLNFEMATDAPLWVLADRARIRQILMNLVGNAIKFTDEGHIDVLLKGSGNAIELIVRDTGVGIPVDRQQEIFEPFVQADSSVERRFGGSGLGLTVVQRLVDLMQGSIALQSKVDAGTTFTLSLPLEKCEPSDTNVEEQSPLDGKLSKDSQAAEPTVNSLAAAENHNHNQKVGVTVLLTDDNVVNRKVANKLLQKLGCDVVEASDGLEALDSISNGNIDIVLMDVQMPNMDGLTATSKIREMSSPICDTPIIGLSANAMPDDQQEMLKAGMDSYLAKPVHLDQLKSAINEVGEAGKRLN